MFSKRQRHWGIQLIAMLRSGKVIYSPPIEGPLSDDEIAAAAAGREARAIRSEGKFKVANYAAGSVSSRNLRSRDKNDVSGRMWLTVNPNDAPEAGLVAVEKLLARMNAGEATPWKVESNAPIMVDADLISPSLTLDAYCVDRDV